MKTQSEGFEKFLRVAGLAFVSLATSAALSLLTGLLLMWCWNYTAVEVFSAPHLGYWHAWAGMYMITLIGNQFKKLEK